MSSFDGVYRVTIQTKVGEVYVSNTYHIIATGMDNAIAQMDNIVINQAALMPNTWFITKGTVSTPDKGDDVFSTVPYNQAGGRTSPGEMMPLFVRWRIDMNVGFRRPCRKFLVGLAEGDQNMGQLTSAAVTFGTNSYVTPMMGDPILNLCDPEGRPVLGMVVVAAVGMRQLRRGSKRKKPIIP